MINMSTGNSTTLTLQLPVNLLIRLLSKGKKALITLTYLLYLYVLKIKPQVNFQTLLKQMVVEQTSNSRSIMKLQRKLFLSFQMNF